MIKEHDKAILTVDLLEHSLKIGDVGTVIHIYPNNTAYELEIFALNGQTLEVITVEATQVRPANQRDILHAREIRTAGDYIEAQEAI